MTTYSVDKNVRKGFPYKFRCRLYGKYDEEFLDTSPNGIDKDETDLTNYDGFDYTIEPKYDINATRVGSLTTTDDAVVGGFSQNNKMFTTYCFQIGSSQVDAGFEIRIHLKTGNSLSNQWILSNGSAWNSGLGLTINSDLGNKFWFIFSNNDNSVSWTFNGSSSLATNTEYWLRLIKEAGNVDTYFQLSTDGINWTTESSNTISVSLPFVTNGAFNFGNLTTGNEYFKGQIYMADTYVKFASAFFPGTFTFPWAGTILQQNVLDVSKTKLPWKWGYQSMFKTNQFAIAPKNQMVSYYGNSLNAVMTGELTLVKAREISAFTGGNYLKLPNAFMPGDKTWEIVWKIRTTTLNMQQYFYGSSTDLYRTVGGELNSANKFCSGISSNGTSWNIGWMLGTTVWQADTWYWVRISFTGTMYKLELSTDGENWNLENSIESSTPIYQDSSKSFMYLGTMGAKNSYWKGKIDLKESYIKIDDKIWWRGFDKTTLQGCLNGDTDDTGQYYAYAIEGDDHIELVKQTGSTIDTDATNPRYLGEVDVA